MPALLPPPLPLPNLPFIFCLYPAFCLFPVFCLYPSLPLSLAHLVLTRCRQGNPQQGIRLPTKH